MRHPKRQKPPIIILKLDDLSQQNGAIVPNFVRIAKLLEERKITAGFGLICAVTWPGAQPLAESSPEYLEQVKRWHLSGAFEIWFHGWDHAAHVINNETCCEFYGRSYAEQKQRFDRAQHLAQDKLGFTFTSFGAGGTISKFSSHDDNTCKVLAQDPHITNWMYPSPIDAAGQRLEATSKIKILDRVMGVNLEKGVGNPDFNWFLENYNQHPERDYFVLQGHPNPWDTDEKWQQVTKILDFLIAEKAVFMQPSAYAATTTKK
ncbi:MAG: hypothetical protein AAB263_05090 [Planctomycetota bacterium]